MNKIVAAAIAAAVMMPAASFAAEAPKVSGFVQFDYRMGDANDVTSADGFGEQQFNVRRARVAVSGKVTPLVGYGIQLQGDDAQGTIFRDMFATLNFNPLAKVTAGLFKYEFDMEGRESGAVMPFIDRPDIVNRVADGFTGAPGNGFRDKGVQLSGEMDMGGMGAGYAVGIWEGSGLPAAQHAAGGNNDLMYTANLFVSPIKGFKVNAGYGKNDLTPDNRTAATAQNEITSWTVGTAYENGPMFARAEYYNRESGAANTETKGWYVVGAYSVLPTVDVMARYQTADLGVAESEFSSVDLGAKYYFKRVKNRGGSNFAVNYMIRDADANYGTRVLNERGQPVSGANVENVAMARLQVAF